MPCCTHIPVGLVLHSSLCIQEALLLLLLFSAPPSVGRAQPQQIQTERPSQKGSFLHQKCNIFDNLLVSMDKSWAMLACSAGTVSQAAAVPALQHKRSCPASEHCCHTSPALGSGQMSLINSLTTRNQGSQNIKHLYQFQLLNLAHLSKWSNAARLV